MKNLPVREYAHPFDRPIQGEDSTHGVSPSSDAIGGYYGLGWYQHFEDHRTGERFRVHCSDGTYGGKDAHSDQDLRWLDQCREHIKRRTAREVKAGAAEVRLSTIEWHLMLNFTADGWIDRRPGQQSTQVDRTLREGLIGHSQGVPVIVDPTQEPNLPERSTLVYAETETSFCDNGRWPTFADLLSGR